LHKRGFTPALRIILKIAPETCDSGARSPALGIEADADGTRAASPDTGTQSAFAFVSLIYAKQITLVGVACRGRRPPTDRTLAEHIVSVCLLLRALINTQSLLRLRISSHTNTFSRNPIRPAVVADGIQLACLLIKKGSVRLSFIIARLHYPLPLSLFHSQSAAAACGSGKSSRRISIDPNRAN
jgi:hypothetical protein